MHTAFTLPLLIRTEGNTGARFRGQNTSGRNTESHGDSAFFDVYKVIQFPLIVGLLAMETYGMLTQRGAIRMFADLNHFWLFTSKESLQI
jgi:hypothetical protein